MAPPDSGPHGRRPMPEELVLLCTDPVHGRMPVPAAAFYRALTGASPVGACGPDGPDLQLAGLIGAARLDRRIFPGPENTEVRKAARRLVKELPVARAVRRLVDADNASGG
ncbi:hypothetical protein ACFVYP_07535 [Kitasatospora sp. NPDC058201]|uniref:hypothetical protein n=1 Tax=unclassified Kitasatospora TaxID=2633591 RepID=UPI00364E7821